ncbi:LOW QUALITY PROTEIN: cytosolic carboxypeptidase 4 [Daphnia magna]|uniref:LOW QUALITY PROTEIN: cytosolic carboxypeptidase 4 n=1 Tax=Daphnia magna TaxID=35525 RepID=UPI001E1BA97B|nr:LOW QUALITY PROTEIN: cytosolic carboxypeptidase 4 [Daphnia magna]
MVEEDFEQILREWNSIAENIPEEIFATLISRTKNLLSCFQDAKGLRQFLERLYNSIAFPGLANLLKITRNNLIRGDILYIIQAIFEVLLATKKDTPLLSVVSPALLLLWPILIELAFEFGFSVLTEHRFLALDILNHIFKNKTNALTVCQRQTFEANQLVLDVLKLLESKGGNRKLTLKQHKCAASILSSISRHKEGRQLIIEAKVVERLHAFLLTIQNEKNRDTIIQKIGQTILRCVPLHDLLVARCTYSALSYVPFGSSALSGDATSSDSSEESEEEEETGKGSLTDSRTCSFTNGTKKKSKKFHPPTNPYRSAEELEQYRQHFDPIGEQDDKDELANASQSMESGWTRQQIYEFVARRTKSIHGFRLIPCPDWINAVGSLVEEPFFIKDRTVCRSKLFKSLNLVLNPNSYRPVVVYDLDSQLLEAEQTRSIRMEDLETISKHHIDKPDAPLEFESRFESGNLRRAMQVGKQEYDLILNPDVNSCGRQQWFYFRISGEGVCPSNTYTFNIINLEKQRTLFNQGMQPVIFSVKRYLASGNPLWERSGTSICYYRNGFRQTVADQSYWSLSFTLRFPYDNDVVYIAYHYPYTYSQLMTDILTWQRSIFPHKDDRLRVTTLCRSPCGNPVPLLLIDFKGDAKSSCVFMSRVHPGESNSSWVMRGLIISALQNVVDSEQAHPLVILPMLNVDGTVHGCSRTELSNEDLNRRWLMPDLYRHPTIYHAKGLLEFMCRILDAKPVLLCDMHGHSRRFNAFVYGCKASQSWCPDDWSQMNGQGDHSAMEQKNDERDNDVAISIPVFVRLLQSELPLFDADQCSFEVEKSRETTARIVGWRHLGISNIYTLECSLAGSNQHPPQGPKHFNTNGYLQVGQALMKVTSTID